MAFKKNIGIFNLSHQNYGDRALIVDQTINGLITIFIQRGSFWYQISLFSPSFFCFVLFVSLLYTAKNYSAKYAEAKWILEE